MHLDLAQYSALISALINAAIFIGGAAAVVLAGITRYRERRAADMIEVANRWKGLAEVREAEVLSLKQRLAAANVETRNKEAEIESLRVRCDFLWSALEPHMDRSKLSQDRG